MKIKISDIAWVVDEDEDCQEYPELPEEVTVEVPNIFILGSEELDELLSNYLSDTYGFLHEGFVYEKEEKK